MLGFASSLTIPVLTHTNSQRSERKRTARSSSPGVNIGLCSPGQSPRLNYRPSLLLRPGSRPNMALPAATVSLAHPPRLPHDYEWLAEQSSRSKVVFRVFDESSVSPSVWTGEVDTSGFSCPNQNLAGLIPAAYRTAQGEKRGSIVWAEGPYLTQTIADHILARKRQSAINLADKATTDSGELTEIPEDEKSPWISTSKNLTWCIWEVAKRLTRMAENKEWHHSLTTAQKPGTGPIVSLALIKHHSGTVGLNDPRRVYLEAHLDAHSAMNHAVARYKGALATMRVKDAFERAMKEAGRSKEILYYGRIFSNSIDSVTEWTLKVSRTFITPGIAQY